MAKRVTVSFLVDDEDEPETWDGFADEIQTLIVEYTGASARGPINVNVQEGAQ